MTVCWPSLGTTSFRYLFMATFDSLGWVDPLQMKRNNCVMLKILNWYWQQVCTCNLLNFTWSVQKRPRANIPPVQSQASFITQLKMFRKYAMIMDWKNVTNFKHTILIKWELTTDVYSCLILNKTEGEERLWKEKKRNLLC